MTPQAFSNQWPCELNKFDLSSDLSLSDSTVLFLRDIGLPSFFEVESARLVFRGNLVPLHSVHALPDRPLADDMLRWLIMADIKFDVGDDPSYICLDPTGKVHFITTSSEHGNLTQVVALSIQDMANCMLGIFQWHQRTSGSLDTGESVIELLKLINRPCFSLNPNARTCTVCLSDLQNSASTFWLGNSIFHMFSTECNGADSFPENIDVKLG